MFPLIGLPMPEQKPMVCWTHSQLHWIPDLKLSSPSSTLHMHNKIILVGTFRSCNLIAQRLREVGNLGAMPDLISKADKIVGQFATFLAAYNIKWCQSIHVLTGDLVWCVHYMHLRNHGHRQWRHRCPPIRVLLGKQWHQQRQLWESKYIDMNHVQKLLKSQYYIIYI